MKRADRRDQGRLQERRERVAYEAARLIAQHGLQDYQQAKLRAARQLGFVDDASLPNNVEVQAQLRDYQRLFQADEQPRHLRARREAALEALEFFAAFEPRLVGSVLDGTADGNAPVNLHVFSDDPDSFSRLLIEQGLPARSIEHRLRLGRKRVDAFPAWAFLVDGLQFEVTVLPTTLLRQAPLSPIDNRPMQRAGPAAVRNLLADAAG